MHDRRGLPFAARPDVSEPPLSAIVTAASCMNLSRRRGRVAHLPEILIGTVIDDDQQHCLKQAAHHFNAAVQALSIELPAEGGCSVDKLASEQINPLDQPVENQAPFLLDIPRAGI